MRACIFLLLTLLTGPCAWSQSSANFRILADVFDSGGLGRAAPSSASYHATSSLGQATALHTSRGSNTVLSSGIGCVICDFLMQTSVSFPTAPGTPTLKQNYPNPVHTSTTFEFIIPEASLVTLEVFNMMGIRVNTLLDEALHGGVHRVHWGAVDLPNGIYFYRLTSRNQFITRFLAVQR